MIVGDRMKTKKILILLLMLLITPMLLACDIVWNINTPTEGTYTATLPEPVDGIVDIDIDDYNNFGVYESIIYETDDVEAFYDQIILTQNMIRHANIEVYNHQYATTSSHIFGTQTQEVGLSSGSGFIFMEDEQFYYAITNYHVIDSEGYDQSFEVMCYGDEIFYSADLIASDESLDLAVLKFYKNSREDIEILDIYERTFYKFNQGEVVLAVGNPKDVYNIVTVGELVSLETINNVDYYVIYHNAQIDEGSSGGALVDINGHLIGVNTWGLDEDEIYSFSIPNYIVYMFLVNQGIIENE